MFCVLLFMLAASSIVAFVLYVYLCWRKCLKLTLRGGNAYSSYCKIVLSWIRDFKGTESDTVTGLKNSESD